MLTLECHHDRPSLRAADGLAVPSLDRQRQNADVYGGCYLAAVAAAWAASLVIGFIPALTLLTYIGLLAATVGLVRPILGLLGITTVCTMNSIAQVWVMNDGILRWNTLNYLLLVVMLVNLPLLLRLRDIQTRLLQGLTVVLLVGLMFSSSFFLGLNYVLNIITVFGFVAYCSRAIQIPRMWQWVGLVNGLLPAAGGAVYFLQYDRLPSINANTWALFPLTGMFCICLALPFAAKSRHYQLLAWPLVAANATWIFVSGSRGAMLSAICCIVYLWSQIPRASQRAWCFITFVLVGLFVSIHFQTEWHYGHERVNLLFDSGESIRTRTSGRSDIAVGSVRMFLSHPLGIGTGAFHAAWGTKAYTRALDYGKKKNLAAHSAWLKVLVENGIPGITVFTCYVLSFAYMGWRKRQYDLFSLGLTISVTLSVTFLAYEYAARGVWLMAAAGMVVLAQTDAHLTPLTTHGRRADG